MYTLTLIEHSILNSTAT